MQKKILFATTALVATASVAAADVTFSGYGRFGVKYTGSLAQSATNAAAAAEREAQALIQFDNFVSGGVSTPGEITAVEALTAFEDISLNGNGLLTDEALSAADLVDTATDPFTSAYDAFDYAKLTATTQLSRASGFITALKASDIADADALVYNPETGKVTAVATAAIPAAAAGTSNVIEIAAAAQSIADTAATLAAGGTPTVGTVVAADIEQAIEDALLVARTEAGTLAIGLNDFALAETILPAAVATDAIVSDMMITSRLRLNIDASAESDSGITFGARIRIQQGEGEIGTANAARFYAKTGGLEVGVGNIYGALESMAGQYPIDLGLTGLGYEYTAYGVGGADAYSSGATGASGRNGVEVMYSAGDFSAHISASDADAAVATSSDRVAATVAYTMSDWTVALGMQDSDAATDVDWTATVGGKIGGVSLGLGYAETNAGVDRTVMTVGMDVGAATNVEAYIADQSDRPDTGYGVDFNHSLGGGTSIRGGVASLTTGQTIADFGVRFNF